MARSFIFLFVLRLLSDQYRELTLLKPVQRGEEGMDLPGLIELFI